MNFKVYQILNLKNGFRYIGCSKNFDKRKSQHLKLLKSNKHKNPYLQNAFNKYGFDSFEFNVIKSFDNPSDMYLHEINCIKNFTNLYNIANGGIGGDTFTNRTKESKDATRLKISNNSKKSNLNNLKLHSENTKNLWKNKAYSDKVKINLDKVRKSSEYRNKISIGVKKHLLNPKSLKVWSDCKKGNKNGRWLGFVLVKIDGKLKYKFDSISECVLKTGISRNTISNKIKNRGYYKNSNSKFNGCTFELDS